MKWTPKRTVAAAFVAAVLGAAGIALLINGDSVGADLPYFKWPRSPGSAGTTLPERGSLDFDNSEYAGVTDNDGINERMSWVKDPAGSNTTVARIHMLKNDDSGVSPSGHRAELYSRNRDMVVGSTYWEVVIFQVAAYNKLWIGSGRQEYMVTQHHNPGDGQWCCPPQEIIYDHSDRTVKLENKPHGPTSVTHTLVSAPTNRWIYVVTNSITVSDSSGFTKAWAKVGGMPDLTKPPAYSESGIYTNNGGSEPSRAHIGLYYDDPPYPELKGWWAYYGRGPKAQVLAGVPVLG